MANRFVAFDLEMPGQRELRISAIGITVVENGEIVDSFYHLVNPETEFEPYVIELVGITPEMVKNEPTFPEIWREIEDIMSSGVLVAHGAPGDLRALCGCLDHYGIKWKDKLSYVCTCDVGLQFFPHLEHYSLNYLCEHIDVDLQHHNALSDSEGCARLMLHYMEHGFNLQDNLSTFNALRGEKLRKNKSNKSVTEKVKSVLFSMSTPEAKEKTMNRNPHLDEKKVIGVSVNRIKSYAPKLIKQNRAAPFVSKPAHKYYEEDLVHAVLISNMGKFETIVNNIDEFLPFIKSFENAELIAPRKFRVKQSELVTHIERWLKSENVYAKVIAFNAVTRNYLTKDYIGLWFEKIIGFDVSESRYLFKKKAEFLGRALVYCESYVMPYFLSGELDKKLASEALSYAISMPGVKSEKKELYIKMK